MSCTVVCYTEEGHLFGINYMMLKQNNPLLAEFQHFEIQHSRPNINISPVTLGWMKYLSCAAISLLQNHYHGIVLPIKQQFSVINTS